MGRDATLVLRCAVVAAVLAVAGCGSKTDTSVTNRMVTPEQEMQDLGRALQAGAITPAEYDQQRRKILVGR